MRVKLLIGLMIICVLACAKEHPIPGVDGLQGAVGATGATSQSCTVTQTSLGVLISCPDGSSGLILHGQNGKDCKRDEKHGKAHSGS